MITNPTVLILGAGASTHCGYPLGKALLSRLCTLKGTSELGPILPARWSIQDVDAFLTRLSRSAHYSIDAFLESSPDDALLGKFLIARELKKHENLDHLFPPHESGWYQYLLNSLLVDGVPEFDKNALSIVTFNYDRSLEAYLHTVLQHRFRMTSERAAVELAKLPIVHVHGILGQYPQVPYNEQLSAADLETISAQIKIVHELGKNDGEFCNPMFEQAHRLLEGASRIYFLGFGFHPDNVRRFRFFSGDKTTGKKLLSTTYGLELFDREHLLITLKDAGFANDSFPHNSANCEYFFRRTALLD